MTVVNAVSGSAAYSGAAESVSNKKKDVESSISVFDAGEANNTIDIDKVCTDGDNNGKLSAKEVAKLAVKGAGEDTKNALLSPLGIAGMIGVAALSICPVTAPFVAPLAVAGAAIGLGAGAIKTVSGVGKMISADTDAEAKGGAKEMGSGVYTAGVSAAAMKSSLNQMAKVEGSHMEAAYRDGTSKTKAYFQDVDDLTGNKFGSLTTKLKGAKGADAPTEAASGGEQTSASGSKQTSTRDKGTKFNNGKELEPNTDLTPEQARINLEEAQKVANGRNFTNKEDWRAAQVKLKQAQLDYDNAQQAQKDLISTLKGVQQ